MKTARKYSTGNVEELLALPLASRLLRARNSPHLLRDAVCRELIETGYAARFADPQGALKREELAAELATEGGGPTSPPSGRHLEPPR